MSYLIPTVVEQTHRGRARLGYLLATAQGPHHLPPAPRSTWRRRHRRPISSSGPDPDKDIPTSASTLPPGGSVTAGLAIYDTMRYVRPQVSHHHLMGQAADGRALLLCAGAKGPSSTLPTRAS